jgi:hypothetical protein
MYQLAISRSVLGTTFCSHSPMFLELMLMTTLCASIEKFIMKWYLIACESTCTLNASSR